RGWKDIVLRIWKNIGKDRVIVVAAGVTFYSILALFPAIAALVALYGLFADPMTITSHLDSIAGLVGLGANTVGPHSATARERDGAAGTPRKLDPRGRAARRTRLCGCAGGGTCAGHRGALEFLAAFHEQR